MKPMLSLLVVCAAASIAVADEPPPARSDPDSEVARRDYQRGSALYDDQKYEEAIAVFRAAYEAHPSPALDYDIARCYDRLGQWRLALDSYKRFMDKVARAPSNDDVAARIAELEARLRAQREPLERAWRKKMRIAGIVVGVAAIASFAAAGGLYGSVKHDYPSREAYCASLSRPCVPSEYADLSSRLDASYALFAIGGVAALADVALFTASVVAPPPVHAWLAPTSTGVSVGASF